MIINKLKEILITEKKFLLSISTSGDLVIKESHKDSKLKKIKIRSFPKAMIGIRMDAFGNKICTFINRSHERLNKGCDALIFVEDNDKKFILIIELKSNNPKGFIHQMKSSYVFTMYLDNILRYYWDLNLSEFKPIFILFSSKKRNKKSYTHPSKDFFDKRKKDNIEYLDIYAIGDKYSFHFKKLIRSYFA